MFPRLRVFVAGSRTARGVNLRVHIRMASSVVLAHNGDN